MRGLPAHPSNYRNLERQTCMFPKNEKNVFILLKADKVVQQRNWKISANNLGSKVVSVHLVSCLSETRSSYGTQAVVELLGCLQFVSGIFWWCSFRECLTMKFWLAWNYEALAAVELSEICLPLPSECGIKGSTITAQPGHLLKASVR